MELNWSTFLLEILNFLVLVWILKRFLFKPVQEAVARRKAQAEEIIAGADAVRAEAEVLRHRYENRLRDWETEKQAARESLRQALQAEQTRAVENLQKELEREREKAQVVEARQRQDRLRHDQALCLEQGARFVSRLLGAVASADLQGRLLDLTVAEIEVLSGQMAENLRLALATSRQSVEVRSAFPLSPGQRERLIAALASLSGITPDCDFAEDPSLLAGTRITAGPWVLHATLADELKSFAESAHESA